MRLAGLFVLLSLSPAAAGEKSAVVSIALYQTSDIHGYVAKAPVLATLFKKERSPDLWIDSGDWFQGTPEGDISRGDAMVEIFSSMGLTAAAVGNHDYDLGNENLERLIRKTKSHYAILGANVVGTEGLLPYVIKEVNGVKIGIFGLITAEMANGLATPNNIKGVRFESEIEAARRSVRELKSKGADVIIAATHLGIEEFGKFHASNIAVGDLNLARQVQGIDLILGGHTHVKVEPAVVVSSGSHKTWIFQPGAHLDAVYQIVLNVDAKAKTLSGVESRLIDVSADRYPADENVRKIVGRFSTAADERMSRRLGNCASVMAQQATQEGALYNWVSDTLRKRGKTDVAIVNTFGVRAAISTGTITYRDMYMVMPFGNQVSTMTLLGAELRRAVERSLPEKPGDAITLRFSGLTVSYDPKAPAGEKTLCSACRIIVNGAPLDQARAYSVTTMDYVALSELQKKRGIQIQDLSVSSELARDVLANEVETHSPISGAVDGRIAEALLK